VNVNVNANRFAVNVYGTVGGRKEFTTKSVLVSFRGLPVHEARGMIHDPRKARGLFRTEQKDTHP
jgi:hypothetical protein